MGFLSEVELNRIGFQHLGENVKISDKAVFYNPSRICIRNNARIDDFCILSAGEEGIDIGQYVHVACFSSMIGKAAIIIKDFAGISGRVSIYSSNDDYSGEYMAHPTIPEKFRNVTNKKVILEKHVIVGAMSIILPGVHIGEGVAIGAHSLVKEDCQSFMIYAGVPAKMIKKRNKTLLKIEEKFLAEMQSSGLKNF